MQGFPLCITTFSFLFGFFYIQCLKNFRQMERSQRDLEVAQEKNKTVTKVKLCFLLQLNSFAFESITVALVQAFV